MPNVIRASTIITENLKIATKLYAALLKDYAERTQKSPQMMRNDLNAISEDAPEFLEAANALLSRIGVTQRPVKVIQVLDYCGSVYPHEDAHFCESNTPAIKECHLLVLSLRRLSTCRGYDGMRLSLYTPKAWTTLNEGSLATFDPRKQHALLSSHRMKAISFWC